jgi:hypothetical protein
LLIKQATIKSEKYEPGYEPENTRFRPILFEQKAKLSESIVSTMISEQVSHIELINQPQESKVPESVLASADTLKSSAATSGDVGGGGDDGIVVGVTIGEEYGTTDAGGSVSSDEEVIRTLRLN